MMRDTLLPLVNFEDFEAVPAGLLPARDNATARALVRADWVLRRKRDGRYLAVASAGRIHALQPGDWRKARQRQAPGAVLQRLYRSDGRAAAATLPLTAVGQMRGRLGIPPDYGHARQLAPVPEPACLTFAGHDRYRRPLWLTPAAAAAWHRMQATAASEGVLLEAISGYRSHAYQLGIFQRKLARGIALDAILAVNAAPGYSEHHSGRALDIGTPGEAAAEESFEATPAFAWLGSNAAGFGFVLSYPRDNRHGISFEPWHWCLWP